MGMYLDLSALDDAAVERVVADPELAWDDSLAATQLFLDKAWHGLHYLLTGTAYEGSWPEAFLLDGGRGLLDEDAVVRLLDAKQVSEVAAALQQVDMELLRSRYNPMQMVELDIYPHVWLHEGDEALDWLLELLTETQKFMAEVAKAGQSLIINIS